MEEEKNKHNYIIVVVLKFVFEIITIYTILNVNKLLFFICIGKNISIAVHVWLNKIFNCFLIFLDKHTRWKLGWTITSSIVWMFIFELWLCIYGKNVEYTGPRRNYRYYWNYSDIVCRSKRQYEYVFLSKIVHTTVCIYQDSLWFRDMK